MAQIGTTMLGFMLAALAVLASINHTHLVQMMKQSGHYSDLLQTIFIGAILFLVSAVMSSIVLFGFDAGPSYLAALLGVSVGALFAVCDSGRKFWMVLKNLQAP